MSQPAIWSGAPHSSPAVQPNDLPGSIAGKILRVNLSSGKIWTEVQSLFQRGYQERKPDALALVAVRYYPLGDKGPGADFNGIRYYGQTLGPMVGEFAIQAETWIRYWALFNPQGETFEFSFWVADEKRDPVRLLDKAPIVPNREKGFNQWNEFWFEYGTSSHLDPKLVERVAYIRNLLMLSDAGDMAGLLVRPEK